MSVFLITGGGFLCKELLKKLLPTRNKIRVISRSAKSLEEIEKELGWPGNLRLWQGDITDQNRMLKACENVDFVINTAANKRIQWCEDNVDEAYDANYFGVTNLCFVCHEKGVKKFLQISTDKAYNPQLTYGYSKAAAEQYTIKYNRESARTKFSACRYGNVWGSSGSVIELWDKLYKEGRELPIINPYMTRFFISPSQAANFILDSLQKMRGREIFIPKLKSISLGEILYNRYPNAKTKTISIRADEKLHEEMAKGYTSDKNLVSYEGMMGELAKEKVEFFKEGER